MLVPSPGGGTGLQGLLDLTGFEEDSGIGQEASTRARWARGGVAGVAVKDAD